MWNQLGLARKPLDLGMPKLRSACVRWGLLGQIIFILVPRDQGDPNRRKHIDQPKALYAEYAL